MTGTQVTDTEMQFDSKNGASESINQLRHLNDTPVINQLPIELLLWILESVLAPWYYGYGPIYYGHLCALSEVCSHWYSIVQHSPQLWTTVPGNIREEGLRKVLDRSSGKLLHVEYGSQLGYRLQYDVPHFVDFVGAVSSTTRRWRTFILDPSDHPGDRPGDFLQFPAPNLERLEIRNDFGWEMEDVELFGGICPNLKHIDLNRAEFNWSQTAFKGLETLKLSEVTFNSIETILDVIRDIPQLKTLDIHYCYVSEKLPSNTQPVSLPNLQFLRAEFYEFDSNDGLPYLTELFLRHISVPPQCPLYTSLAEIKDKGDSFVATFCEWLFGRQTKEVFQGVESVKLGFDLKNDAHGAVNLELFSGSTSIKGGTRGLGKDFQYVLKYIQGIFQQSHVSEPFTTLKLIGCGFGLFNDSRLIGPIKDLPPITCLELEQPSPGRSEDVDWSEDADWSEAAEVNEGVESSEDVHDGSVLCTASPFSTVKSLILREVSPDDILGIVLEALGDPQARSHSMSQFRLGKLDYVEVHVDENDFTKVEAVVEVLRNDPRIGKVDLYVTLY
ncbi:hypothetical protein M407DRAFT_27950 [Tulasnella calospora MUT 4182]|uniref:F-box domain-containing protein n=1 Tax=Tulasnella calospora MUT 4182 TaxID=1051891 RepID=A0A0C3LMH6_9AGAM|nr:hypothetical protein M407DRAFT_27950 [Tulasnella calospora MUT 4182]